MEKRQIKGGKIHIVNEKRTNYYLCGLEKVGYADEETTKKTTCKSCIKIYNKRKKKK